MDVLNFLQQGDLAGISRFHELNEMDLQAPSGGSDGQTHGPGGLADPTAVKNMNQTVFFHFF